MSKLFHYLLVALAHVHIARLDMLAVNLVRMILKLSWNAVNKLLKKESLKYGLHQKTLELMEETLEQVSLNYLKVLLL
jgi:hypothetical protein